MPPRASGRRRSSQLSQQGYEDTSARVASTSSARKEAGDGEEGWSRLRRESNLSTLSLSPRRLSNGGSQSTVTRGGSGTVNWAKRRASALRHFDEEEQDDNDNDNASVDVDARLGPEDDDEWTLVDRMRNWRNDAMTQHLYGTAEFWGSKVFEMTANANDAFWLAQTHFMTHQYAAAERILTQPRRRDAEHRRLTDTSLACRYLAAQCQVRLGRWDDALELVGKQTGIAVDHLTDDQHQGDGGIKVCLSSSLALSPAY